MTPLIFAIIAGFGAAYYAGWLINIGIWFKRKTVPSWGALWLPLFIGVIFIGVDIYGFTIFPNNSPAIAWPLVAILVHGFLFFGTIIQARALGKHRCPMCGGWMEIEKTTSEPSMDEIDVITITAKCKQCDYQKSNTKKSQEGIGHTTDWPKYSIHDEDLGIEGKKKSSVKDTDFDEAEHIDIDDIGK